MGDDDSLPHRTRIYAHRGASGAEPENTQRAFDLALAVGAEGIETDVQLTKDGCCVLWHDDHLGRLGRRRLRVEDFDWETLSALGQERGLPVMRLSDFWSRYGTRCGCVLEIKHRPKSGAYEDKVLETLRILGQSPPRSVIVSSFHLESLVYAHEINANVSLVYNLERRQSFHEVLIRYGFLRGICLPFQDLREGLVEELHRDEKIVATYTCNSERQIRKGIECQADIVMTDYPQNALAIRSA